MNTVEIIVRDNGKQVTAKQMATPVGAVFNFGAVVFWGYLEYKVVVELVSSFETFRHAPAATIILDSIAFLLWHIFGLVFVYFAIWRILGQQTIILQRPQIIRIIGIRIFNLGWKKSFDMAGISKMRLESMGDNGSKERSVLQYRIVFDYQGKTTQMLHTLSSGQAETLLNGTLQEFRTTVISGDTHL